MIAHVQHQAKAAGLCGALANDSTFHPVACIRRPHGDSHHLAARVVCPACDAWIFPEAPFGPAQPCKLDDGTAFLHRLCRDRLADERGRASLRPLRRVS